MPQSTRSSRKIEPKKASPRIVAAIPCFNTGSSIKDVVSKTRKYVDRVIVIDDGSHDGTLEEARNAGALVKIHTTNRGYGAAINSCFKEADADSADILVILDGDGQHDADEIPAMLQPVLQEEADLVIGSRFLNENGSMPKYRRFGIRAITWLFNLLSHMKVTDAQSGFRIYTRKYFTNMPLGEKGMSVSIETLQKAKHRHAIVKEVPISCKYTQKHLDLRSTRHGLGVVLAVLKLRIQSIFW